MKGVGIAALAALLAASPLAMLHARVQSGQDQPPPGPGALPASEDDADPQARNGDAPPGGQETRGAEADSAGNADSAAAEGQAADGEMARVSPAVVDEATQRLSPAIPGMSRRSLRAVVDGMSAEFELHHAPGMSSSQLDDLFRNFSGCLGANLWGLYLNRTYPDDIPSAAERQLHACAPYFRSQDATIIELVGTLLERMRPRQ
jgi:hypothetical protein